MTTSNMKVTILCPIEIVWDTVTNLKDFSWRSDLKDVKIIDEHNFIEIAKNGIETYFRITECIKYQSWIFEIDNKNIKGTWVGKFFSKGDKTILDFTENVISKKIIFKPFISFYLKRQQKHYFRDLKVKLNCEELKTVR
ncbi:polyketide cyclase [uncultured Veillonella sp.]|uniref:polyketide cyclase n=1 Tax=uncultured Veillonella sp. TaxID=159268 RepID=UPI002585C340|nr:polyketide cyclase [uncultured Veillonella sp.]